MFSTRALFVAALVLLGALVAGQPWLSAGGKGKRTETEPTATPVSLIKVKKDFKVELLYSVPPKTQGSWVSMCVDPKGRLIVSDQDGKLYRVTPPTLGQTAGAKVEPIEADIGEAQGLLWAFDSLYVVVNRARKYPDQDITTPTDSALGRALLAAQASDETPRRSLTRNATVGSPGS